MRQRFGRNCVSSDRSLDASHAVGVPYLAETALTDRISQQRFFGLDRDFFVEQVVPGAAARRSVHNVS